MISEKILTLRDMSEAWLSVSKVLTVFKTDKVGSNVAAGQLHMECIMTHT